MTDVTYTLRTREVGFDLGWKERGLREMPCPNFSALVSHLHNVGARIMTLRETEVSNMASVMYELDCNSLEEAHLASKDAMYRNGALYITIVVSKDTPKPTSGYEVSWELESGYSDDKEMGRLRLFSDIVAYVRRNGCIVTRADQVPDRLPRWQLRKAFVSFAEAKALYEKIQNEPHCIQTLRMSKLPYGSVEEEEASKRQQVGC